MFRRNMSPPSSLSKCEPSSKPDEASGKLVMIITTNIPMKRMARRLEGNMGKCAVVGSVTARGEHREVRSSGERNSSRGI
jgi:hypothetical protein